MIRAVIFDCFGVLVSESWLAFKQHHFDGYSVRADEATSLMQQADAGLLSQIDFVDQVAELSGLSPEQVRDELDGNQPNEPLFEYIKTELKPKYKIGMLSNAGADWLSELFTEEQLALFDAVALSFEMGFTKPEVDSYLKIAQKLEVEPQECVFLDDQERHCTGAREAGMASILFKGYEQARADLEKILTEDLAK
jgi:HAD superfamily hydrolase (TIGR01509 family)